MNKNVLIVLIVIVVVCCCGGGAAFFFVFKKGVDMVGEIQNEGKPFAESAIKDIAQEWDPSVMRNKCVPEMSDSVIQDFCTKLQPLGKCQSLDLSMTNVSADSKNGDNKITLSYKGTGMFEKGKASVDCTVVKHNSKWGITSINIVEQK